MHNIDQLIHEIVQGGDTQQFNQIVLRYQKQIYIYCYRMLGQRQEAEDATQEVFIRAYEKLHSYRTSVSFSAWLYKIASNYCLNRIRKRKLMQKIKQLLLLQTTTSTVEHALSDELFSQPLADALTKLAADERTLFILRIFEEKSFEEIGQILQQKTETVKKRYERSKKKVRKWISEREEDEKNVAHISYS